MPSRHGPTPFEPVTGWCAECYRDGAFVLATGPGGRECLFHGAQPGRRATPGSFGVNGPPTLRAARRRPRTPRGRAARVQPPRPASRPPGRPLPRAVRRDLSRSAARALAYGRRRACARVDSGRWGPHPGWRHFIETGWRVMVDQAEAWRRVERLVDAEDWRADKRRSWLHILRRLVNSMDWSTGLVTGVTAQRLGDAGDRAARTVSRVLAWARDIGLVVVVECGASAAFLGSRTNRTPTYALVTDTPPAAPAPPEPEDTGPVDQTGDLPLSYVSSKPLQGGRRPLPASQCVVDWPVFQVPDTPAERTAAALCLFKRIGLDHRGVSRVPLWRARALLRPWWGAGACVAGILHALDHHPDRPDHHRGDALRGATDPLRVLGHRLKPWKGRLHELPAAVVGIRGDHLRLKAEAVARRAARRCSPVAEASPPQQVSAAASPAPAVAPSPQPGHLAVSRADRAAVAGQLVHRVAGEVHEQRPAAARPGSVAGREAARALWEQARQQIRAARSAPPLPAPPVTGGEATAGSAPMSSTEIHQRALEVARADGPRCSRRRNRW
ncbi:hypothetical protein ACVGVM_29500 (plasmid) [Pseudonocardia bannensis]|uniref:Uncharacterized protein n=1 Tax=Pseudonocardia bannensis TaxID=630973 RepID=A0A848DP34_9PSEU|nr:hypothetical protein [Pseudonocardia bannensis]NMH94532.1 hypothetical protein [Pseudonocardia bannensis]